MPALLGLALAMSLSSHAAIRAPQKDCDGYLDRLRDLVGWTAKTTGPDAGLWAPPPLRLPADFEAARTEMTRYLDRYLKNLKRLAEPLLALSSADRRERIAHTVRPPSNITPTSSELTSTAALALLKQLEGFRDLDTPYKVAGALEHLRNLRDPQFTTHVDDAYAPDFGKHIAKLAPDTSQAAFKPKGAVLWKDYLDDLDWKARTQTTNAWVRNNQVNLVSTIRISPAFPALKSLGSLDEGERLEALKSKTDLDLLDVAILLEKLRRIPSGVERVDEETRKHHQSVVHILASKTAEERVRLLKQVFDNPERFDPRHTDRLVAGLLDMRKEEVVTQISKMTEKQKKGIERHFAAQGIVDSFMSQLDHIHRVLPPMQPGQKVVDFGSGLGTPAFYFSIQYPGIEYLGYEIVRPKLKRSREVAKSLGMTKLRFLAQDLSARGFKPEEADYYYLFNPVHPEIAERLIDSLKPIAARRKITVIAITVPGTGFHIAANWLREIYRKDDLTIFESGPPEGQRSEGPRKPTVD